MNRKILSTLVDLSNIELLERVKRLAEREREALASLIAHLAELDERRLYLGEGYSSLFAYCTQELRLSEHAAYGRIEAARIIRRFPAALEMLEQGALNLTTLCLLTAHLTDENHLEVLKAARHRSKRQVEELVARLNPQPPVPSVIRKLPTMSHITASPPARTAASPQQVGDDQSVAGRDLPTPTPSLTPSQRRPDVLAPLAPERYKVQFTASAETYKKLRLAQNLLRHQIPDGDLAAILDRALTALLEDLARNKLAATDRPRETRGASPGSRHIPAKVKREVWLRDGGQCAFLAHNGRRCTEEGFLEFHHVTPFAVGGESTADNVELRCRAHNGYEAELEFGSCSPSIVKERGCSYTSLNDWLPTIQANPSATRSRPSNRGDIALLQSRPLPSSDFG